MCVFVYWYPSILSDGCVLQVVAFLNDIRARFSTWKRSPSYDVMGKMYINIVGMRHCYAFIQRTHLSDELTQYDYYYHKNVAKDAMA